ncbi:MAG: IS200/IS605 family transposase [Bacteroidales bacterium]|nr:IS200/IS605 family transposase [Bacteroidales bacterium]
MLHTHSKIWIHLIWTTKNREPVLNNKIGIKLYDHLINYSKDTFSINFERLNIQKEHIHGLIDLPTNIMLSEFMQKLKGESSHWLNQSKMFRTKFSWQRGFGAYSVSASQLDIVKRYIENQGEHHKKSTFLQEYEQWKKEYSLFDD